MVTGKLPIFQEPYRPRGKRRDDFGFCCSPAQFADLTFKNDQLAIGKVNASSQVRTITSSPAARRATGMGTLSLSIFSLVGKGLLFLLFVFFMDDGKPAFALELNALWQNNLSGGDNSDVLSNFKQVYKVNDGILLDVTDAISAGASISYNRNIATGKATSELLSPGATFTVHNDIFNLGFSGLVTQNRTAGASELDTSHWQTTLAPGSYPWDPKYWPGISVYFGKSRSTLTGQSGYDSMESTYGGSLNFVLPKVANLFYGYDVRRTENLTSQRVDETSTHFGRLDTGGEFWDGRGIVKFSQGIRQQTATQSGIVPASGVIEQIPEVTFTYYSLVDESDPGSVLVDFSLSDHANAVLGNLENTSTIGIGPGQSWHLSVSPVFAPTGAQQVDQLRVYVDDPFDELNVNQGVLQWDLYASFDNSRWEPVAGNVAAVYNTVDHRFEIDIPALGQNYQFLMAVVSNRSPLGATADTVRVRAVESVPLSEGQPGSSFTNSSDQLGYTTNGTLQLLIGQNARAFSNLTTQYGAGYFFGVLNSSLHWTPTPWTAPSVGFSETLQNATGTDESISRTYSMSVPVFLLPTFNINFGATQNDRFSGGQRNSVRNTYLFGATAALYPDLTAALTETYNTGRKENIDGTSSEDENFGGTLTLKAILNSKLTCELANTFQKIYKPRNYRNEYTDVNFFYRPSDLLSLEVRLEKNWFDSAADSQRLALRLVLLRSRKVRVDFNSQYRHIGNEIAQKSFGLQGSWDISKIFTLKSQGVYGMGATNNWSVMTSLYMRL